MRREATCVSKSNKLRDFSKHMWLFEEDAGQIFCNYRVSCSAIPRLVLASAAEAHIVNHAKNSHTHGNQHQVEGGREEPGETRFHGVGDEAADKVGAHRHEEGVGDDDATGRGS